MIDLRSDTVTKPTEAMRRAMATAEVGDDVYREDPTVSRLEERTAQILGKEAAIFMPSGTMTNQSAIKCHTQPGDEILIESHAHIHCYEAGAPAALSGVTCRLIEGSRGRFTADDVRSAIRPANVPFPSPRLLCVENTHNAAGGRVWPLEAVEEVTAAAHSLGLATHLDGARLWNAAVAAGVPEAEYARHFDTVSVCFSKGLGAPVGSALAGSAEFVSRARRVRKLLGGGMRQAGVIAAGALFALERHRNRLTEDHALARRLAEELAQLDGIRLRPSDVETNIILFGLETIEAAQFCGALRKRGVLMLPRTDGTVRAVTSLAVSEDDIEAAVRRAREALRELG